MLNEDERTILVRFCSDHFVASCPACAATYRLTQLAVDFMPYRLNRCRKCRADLTESLREHLQTCPNVNARVTRLEGPSTS